MEEIEKKDIQDAEVSQVNQEENTKKNYRTEIILIFVIGLLVGIMIKAEAVKRISIGFSDYKTITNTQEYDIEAIEKSLFEESEEAEAENVIIEDTEEIETE
jgi:hypothetical protein